MQETQEMLFNPWVGKSPWRRKWQPTPVFLPGESHGWRSLGGYSPRGRKESDTTERLYSLTQSYGGSLVCNFSLFSCCFKNSLFLSFDNYNMSWCSLFGFNLFGILFGSRCLVLSQGLGIFQPLFTEIHFLSLSSF